LKIKGACCRAFCLFNFDNDDQFLAQVRRDTLALLAGQGTEERRQQARDDLRTAQMVIPLPARLEDWPEDARQVMKGQAVDLKAGPWYRCRYHDKETGLCAIYDRRPPMCRSHGTDTPCNFRNCVDRVDGKCGCSAG
jgi:Fe-S-cluster containining protein